MQLNPRLWLNCFILLLIGTSQSGCDTTQVTDDVQVPPDFSLVLNYQTPPPAQRSATFIIEPNRTLRSATGPGCTLNTFPDPTTRLTNAQVQELYDLARDINSTKPNSDESIDPENLYQIRLKMTANDTVAHKTIAIRVKEMTVVQGQSLDVERAVLLATKLHEFCELDGPLRMMGTLGPP